jgi:hypothetical protein
MATLRFLFFAESGINAASLRYSPLREQHKAMGQPHRMTKRPSASSLGSTKDNAVMGALAGMGITSLHHVHHAVSNQVPDNILTHVLSESAMGTLAGETLTAAASALVSRFRRDKEIR